MDTGDGRHGSEPGRQAEPGSVELRRRICAVSELISKIDAERYALEEIRDDLELKLRDLGQRLSALQREQTDLRGRVEAQAARLQEVEADIGSARDETATLERRYRDRALLLAERGREAEALELDLVSCRADAFAAESALETVHASIARMDRKLLFVERKRVADGEQPTDGDRG